MTNTNKKIKFYILFLKKNFSERVSDRFDPRFTIFCDSKLFFVMYKLYA